MSELRRDPLRGRWVVIDPEQPVRPEMFLKKAQGSGDAGEHCPLCQGNESIQGPQLYYACGYGLEKSGRDSCVKVIPNGRPLLRVERELTRHAKGPYDLVAGVGAHEVIIETPDHGVRMEDQKEEAIAQVFTAVRVRMADLRNDVRLRYHLFFEQEGRETGARFNHSHSQILATPETPPFIQTEIKNAREHFLARERCLLCDLLNYERESGARLVAENSKFAAIAPYASARPFELWLMPKRHCHDIVDSVCEDVRELAFLLKDMLLRLKSALDGPPYTMMLVNSPSPHYPPGRQDEWSMLPHFFHWRLTLVPRVTALTALDWDAGLPVNPVAPERAAEYLRSLGGVAR